MELLTTQEFTLPYPPGSARENDVVSGDIRYIDDGRARPLLLIAHGFKTYKDWGMFPYAGEYFAELGFVTVVINFARNGVRPGEKKLTDWRLFAANTPSFEVDDIHMVLDAIDEGALEYYGINVDETKQYLLGHSGGGGVSLIAASERKDITGVVAWAPIATFDRFTDEEKKFWRAKRELLLKEDPEHGQIRVGLDPLDDIEVNAERLNICTAVRRYNGSILIVHGDQDPTVPLDEGKQLYEIAGPEKGTFVIIPDADHLFGVSHPYTRDTAPHLEQVLRETKKWLPEITEDPLS
jgi:uncharacterized protein